MELQRTANAGCLLRLDDVSILLDGVCREVDPYLATPLAQRAFLQNARIDLFAFTHDHEDHFDPYFSLPRNACVLGTAEVAAKLSGANVVSDALQVSKVKVTPVVTRHMGKASPAGHFSIVLEGSKCVWFMGDASPIDLEKMKSFPKPDVLIAPFPYVSSSGAVRKVNGLGAEAIVLLHMPAKENDPAKLWDGVTSFAPLLQGDLVIPNMGEKIQL